jgi:hypothetical protein
MTAILSSSLLYFFPTSHLRKSELTNAVTTVQMESLHAGEKTL